MNARASLKGRAGITKSGCSSNSCSSASWNADRRKNQFSSCSRVSGISWIGQRLPSRISFSTLKSAHRGQYQPSYRPL